MGTVAHLWDSLTNAITGAGTRRDPRSSSTYAIVPLTQHDIEAAYRGSGLMRKIVQIPALDMVREWRDWTGLDADQLSKVYDAETRFALRQKVKQAEVLRGLGGGALVMGLPGDPATPAPVNAPLAFVNVVSRWHLSFNRLDDNAASQGFGEPEMWTLSSTVGQVNIHPSRVIPFRADTAGMVASLSNNTVDAFWGDSTVAQVLDAVRDNDTARAAFASLLHKARTLRLGIPGLMEQVGSPGGQDKVQKRLATLVLAESTLNAFVYDSGDGEGKGGESITDAQYNFSGAKDILNTYAEFVAAVSDIPATRLLGRAPEGMNSSGDSQQRDWAKKVRAMQTLDLAPLLDRLDRHLLPAALGTVPATIAYDFAPLDLPSEKEKAERFKVYMEGLDKLAMLNAMPERAFNEGVQSLMTEEGFLPGLEGALAAIPEDERYGIEAGLEAGDDSDDGREVIDPSAGEGGPDAPARRAVNDAAPRTLYVSRPVLNRADLQKWATAQGLGELQPDLHVTIAYSRQPVDWMKVEGDWNQSDDGTITIAPGGVRIVEPLGDRTAVLLFTASRLAWRHEQIRNAGASWDYPEYQPHISLTGESVDLSGVEPYQGVIELGPERFEEVREGEA